MDVGRWTYLSLAQHFANLFVMALLVIADKRNRCDAVDLAEERMLEDEIAKRSLP